MAQPLLSEDAARVLQVVAGAYEDLGSTPEASLLIKAYCLQADVLLKTVGSKQSDLGGGRLEDMYGDIELRACQERIGEHRRAIAAARQAGELCQSDPENKAAIMEKALKGFERVRRELLEEDTDLACHARRLWPHLSGLCSWLGELHRLALLVRWLEPGRPLSREAKDRVQEQLTLWDTAKTKLLEDTKRYVTLFLRLDDCSKCRLTVEWKTGKARTPHKYTTRYGCPEYVQLPRSAHDIRFWVGAKYGAEPIYGTKLDFATTGRLVFNGTWTKKQHTFGPFENTSEILKLLKVSFADDGITAVIKARGVGLLTYTSEIYIDNDERDRYVIAQPSQNAMAKPAVTLMMKSVDGARLRRMEIRYENNGSPVKWTSSPGSSAEHELPRSARNIEFWFGLHGGFGPLYATEEDFTEPGRKCFNGAWHIHERKRYGKFETPGAILDYLSPADVARTRTKWKVVALLQGVANFCYCCDMYCQLLEGDRRSSLEDL